MCMSCISRPVKNRVHVDVPCVTLISRPHGLDSMSFSFKEFGNENGDQEGEISEILREQVQIMNWSVYQQGVRCKVRH